MKTILIATAALISAASAATIYNNTTVNGPSTFNANGAQSFTTPAAFANGENALSNITLRAASNTGGAAPAAGTVVSLQLFSYTGTGTDSTFDVANTTLVATSLNTQAAKYDGTSYSFDFGNVVLNANSVYMLGVNNGGTQFATFRFGVSTGNLVTTGTSYFQGSTATVNNQDWAGTITTVVPEPSVALLGGLGALALLRRRRA